MILRNSLQGIVVIVLALGALNVPASPDPATGSEGPEATQAPVRQLDFGLACKEPADAEDHDQGPGVREPTRPDPARPFSHPIYPEAAKAAYQEGIVIMLLHVTDEGRIAQARVERSSGFPMLDLAALEATRDWHALPATIDGRPVCAWGRFSMAFRLRDFDEGDIDHAVIRPGAARLFELLSTRPLNAQMSRMLGNMQDDPSAKALTELVMGAGGNRKALDTAYHYGVASISLKMSDSEISDALKYFSSPAGAKVLDVQLEIDSDAVSLYASVLSGTACQMAQLQNSLDKGLARMQTPRGESLPPKFSEAAPGLLAKSDAYCSCAVRQPEWISINSDVSQACGAPPDLTW